MTDNVAGIPIEVLEAAVQESGASFRGDHDWQIDDIGREACAKCGVLRGRARYEFCEFTD